MLIGAPPFPCDNHVDEAICCISMQKTFKVSFEDWHITGKLMFQYYCKLRADAGKFLVRSKRVEFGVKKARWSPELKATVFSL